MEIFINSAFQELFRDDGLMVMGRGLGIQRLYAKLVQVYSIAQRKIVFCINAAEWLTYILNTLKELNTPELEDTYPKVLFLFGQSLSQIILH